MGIPYYLTIFLFPFRSVFVNVVQFCKKLFKRKLPDPVDDLDEVVMQKRIKRECNQSPDVAIRRANLNPQECIYLIQSYADQVSKLRHEFEKEQRQQKSSGDIFPGVCKSRVLTIEAVNTAFIRFKPKSWTEFSVANYDTTFIIHRGGSITLRTVSVGDCNIEHEVRNGLRISRITLCNLPKLLFCTSRMSHVCSHVPLKSLKAYSILFRMTANVKQ